MEDISDNRERVNAQLREAIVKEFPPPDDLDLRRVTAFMTEYGMQMKPYIVVGRDRIGALEQILYENNRIRLAYALSERDPSSAFYAPDLDMTIVVRDVKAEAERGKEFTEGRLIHELTHANGLRYSRDGLFRRSGYGVGLSDEGAFLEEGCAEYVRGEYIRRYRQNSVRRRLLESIGIRDGRGESETATITLSGTNIELPVKYLYLAFDKSPLVVCKNAPPGAIAARALELVAQQYPDFISVVLQSRHDVVGLRRTAQIIDVLSPGLYSMLRKMPRNYGAFLQGLKKVEAAVTTKKR